MKNTNYILLKSIFVLFFICFKISYGQATYMFVDNFGITNKIHFQQENGNWTIQLFDSRSNNWYYATLIDSKPNNGYFKYKAGQGDVFEAVTYKDKCVLTSQGGYKLTYNIEPSTPTAAKTYKGNKNKSTYSYQRDGVIYRICFEQNNGKWAVKVTNSKIDTWSYLTVTYSDSNGCYFEYTAGNGDYTATTCDGKCTERLKSNISYSPNVYYKEELE